MIWIRQTDSDRMMSEIELVSRDLVEPIIRVGRRIPVKWRNPVTSSVPVHAGEPRVQFDADVLIGSEELMPASAAG